jgi:hypothetical protein
MEQCKIEQYGGIPCPIKRRKKEKRNTVVSGFL